MSGLILPGHYRVKKTKIAPFRCLSSDCRMSGAAAEVLYLSSREEICPRCQRKGNLHPLDIIHLIQPSTFRGQIRGSELAGTLDILYEFLCEKSHFGFMEHPRSPRQPRHYTIEPSAATCPACLLEYGATITNATVKLP